MKVLIKSLTILGLVRYDIIINMSDAIITKILVMLNAERFKLA